MHTEDHRKKKKPVPPNKALKVQGSERIITAEGWKRRLIEEQYEEKAA